MDFTKPLNNRYDPYVTKAKIDEYITHHLSTAKKFPINYKYSNAKLTIGFIAVLFTIYAHVHEYMFDAHFPKDYWVVMVCFVFYFGLNFLYQYVEYFIEVEIFFTSNPTIVPFTHLRELSIASSIKKFQDNYELRVYLYVKPGIKLNNVKEMKKVKDDLYLWEYWGQISQFFTEDGHMVTENVNSMIDRILGATAKA